MTTTGGSTPGRCPGVKGPTSSHTAPACSGSGGATNTTWRPRSSAAFASSSVTRSSIVKEVLRRRRDASLRRAKRQRSRDEPAARLAPAPVLLVHASTLVACALRAVGPRAGRGRRPPLGRPAGAVSPRSDRARHGGRRASSVRAALRHGEPARRRELSRDSGRRRGLPADDHARLLRPRGGGPGRKHGVPAGAIAGAGAARRPRGATALRVHGPRLGCGARAADAGNGARGGAAA